MSWFETGTNCDGVKPDNGILPFVTPPDNGISNCKLEKKINHK